MMSSEGSVSSGSSRIRQFGLYRSIDARTEEFLRLSRRRQIRQGCACAAVSTAITVTVVIVVIFVYEFSLNSEVNIKSSLRRNWFSLINDTTEDGFKTKYSKASIDKTTLTLLPMLLKALKKNVFLEKILEEQSNLTSSYEAKQTTDQVIGKNLLTKNSLRAPSSKLYAIAYKTLPIAYYRSPSQNIEYFTKIRKIRDYQRIINYVDKMISEKVYIGSTKPMMKEEVTEKPSIRRKQKSKLKPALISLRTQPRTKAPTKIKNKHIEMKAKKNNCKCSNKLGDVGYVLNKILTGVEKLLSTDGSTKNKTSVDCHHNNNLVQQSAVLVTKLLGLDTKVTTQTIVENTDTEKHIQVTTSLPKKDENKTSQGLASQYINDFRNNETTTSIPINYLDNNDEFQSLVSDPMTSTNKYNNVLEQRSIFNFDEENDNMIDNNPNSNLKQHNTIVGVNLPDRKNGNLPISNNLKEDINDDNGFDNDANPETVFRKDNEIKVTAFWPQKVENRNNVKYEEILTAPNILTKNTHVELEPKPTLYISQKVNKTIIERKINNIEFTREIPQNKYKSLNSTNRKVLNYSNNVKQNKTASEFHKKEEDTYDDELYFDPLKHVRIFKPITFKRPQSPRTNGLTPNKYLENLNKAIYQLILKNKNIQINQKTTTESTPISMTESSTKQPTSAFTTHLVSTESETENNDYRMRKYENILQSAVGEKTEHFNNLTEEDLNKLPENVTNAPVDVRSMMPNLRPVYLEIHQKNEWKHEDRDYDFNILTNYDNFPDDV